MGQSHFDVINPFDQKKIETLAFQSPAEIEATIKRAQTATVAQCSDGLFERMAMMRKVKQLLEERGEDFLALMISEGGKPKRDSKVELGRALQGIEAALAELYQFGGREIPMGLSMSSQSRRAYTRRIPRGINLAISAFNHPLNLLIHQVVAPLLAGCPVILKPALKTPLTAQKFVALFHEAGFSSNQLQLLLVSDDVMPALVADKRLAVVNFIGSAGVGHLIQKGVSLHTKVILEHGGAAPLILGQKAKWRHRRDTILKAAFAHAGQVCVSLQNLFVPTSMIDEVAEALVAGASHLVVGDPRELTTDIGPMIRPESCARAMKSCEDLSPAEILLAPMLKSATLMTPAILRPKKLDHPLIAQEVFAPILNLISYEEREEVVHSIEKSPYAFQAALWSQNVGEINFYERALPAQTFIVNDAPSFRVDWMPFGGFRDSGLGLGGFRATYEEVTREVLTVWNHS